MHQERRNCYKWNDHSDMVILVIWKFKVMIGWNVNDRAPAAFYNLPLAKLEVPWTKACTNFSLRGPVGDEVFGGRDARPTLAHRPEACATEARHTSLSP